MNRNGSEVVQERQKGEPPVSQHLRALVADGGGLSPQMISWADILYAGGDIGVNKLNVGSLDAEDEGPPVQQMMMQQQSNMVQEPPRNQLSGLAEKLLTLAQSRERTPSEMLLDVIAHTDQIYDSVAAGLPFVQPALEQLLASCEGGAVIEFGALKDPVRVYEKATDDYSDRFADNATPAANVIDVVRARGLFNAGPDMTHVLEELQEAPTGYSTDKSLRSRQPSKSNVQAKTRKLLAVSTATGTKARDCWFELIRVKNKFQQLDPTRFRNVLCNMRLHIEGLPRIPPILVELQMHHATILDYNEESHAHSVYNYFRTRLAGAYGKLHTILTQAISFMLDEVCQIPVLLSMLVMAVRGAAPGTEKLPGSLIELYNLAVDRVLSDTEAARRASTGASKSEIVAVLKRISCENMKSSVLAQREFTYQNVQDALASMRGGMACWAELMSSDAGAQLIKITGAGEKQVYQFRHLSIQESFFATSIVESQSEADGLCHKFWGSNQKAAAFLQAAAYKNTARIGGGDLGAAFAAERPEWDFRNEGATESNDVPIKSVSALLKGNIGPSQLNMANNTADAVEGWATLAQALESCQSLKALVLDGCFLGPEFEQIFEKTLKLNPTLESLRFNGAEMGFACELAIAAWGTAAPHRHFEIDRDHTKMMQAGLAISGSEEASNVRVVDLKACIHLSDEYAHNSEAAARASANGLYNLIVQGPSISSLNLERNQLGEREAIFIALGLAKNSTINDLNLGWNSIPDVGLIAIAEALKENSVLCGIELHANAFGRKGIQALVGVLSKTNKTVLSLNLSRNRLDAEAGVTLANALEVGCSHLRELILDFNALGSAGVIPIGDALHGNAHLRVLGLRSNCIDSAGGKRLGHMLATNNTITSIDLSTNILGRDEHQVTSMVAAEALAHGLQENSGGLRHLQLRSNDFSDESVAAIFNALRGDNNTTLRVLDISINNSGQTGGNSAATMLSSNTSLCQFDFQCNGLKGAEIQAIMLALEGNTTLQRLNLAGNHIPDSMRDQRHATKSSGGGGGISGVTISVGLCVVNLGEPPIDEHFLPGTRVRCMGNDKILTDRHQACKDTMHLVRSTLFPAVATITKEGRYAGAHSMNVVQSRAQAQDARTKGDAVRQAWVIAHRERVAGLVKANKKKYRATKTTQAIAGRPSKQPQRSQSQKKPSYVPVPAFASDDVDTAYTDMLESEAGPPQSSVASPPAGVDPNALPFPPPPWADLEDDRASQGLRNLKKAAESADGPETASYLDGNAALAIPFPWNFQEIVFEDDNLNTLIKEDGKFPRWVRVPEPDRLLDVSPSRFNSLEDYAACLVDKKLVAAPTPAKSLRKWWKSTKSYKPFDTATPAGGILVGLDADPMTPALEEYYAHYEYVDRGDAPTCNTSLPEDGSHVWGELDSGPESLDLVPAGATEARVLARELRGPPSKSWVKWRRQELARLFLCDPPPESFYVQENADDQPVRIQVATIGRHVFTEHHQMVVAAARTRMEALGQTLCVYPSDGQWRSMHLLLTMSPRGLRSEKFLNSNFAGKLSKKLINSIVPGDSIRRMKEDTLRLSTNFHHTSRWEAEQHANSSTAANIVASAASSAAQIEWQWNWQTKAGIFVPYDSRTERLLERDFTNGDGSSTFEQGLHAVTTSKYLVDFVEMTQTNTKTNKNRAVQRVKINPSKKPTKRQTRRKIRKDGVRRSPGKRSGEEEELDLDRDEEKRAENPKERAGFRAEPTEGCSFCFYNVK
jgi:Ran GTPase-activating protein (RanGAP) involved in mRNA processing and transport